jgi:uncharacterized phage protein (TIGR02220 family)
MAKELPYFRFEPSAWDTGNIQMCSFQSKGLFADLCSLYWSRLGELPYALALQKLCNGDKAALQELINHQIIAVFDGQITIDFLDEQLEERGQTSEKRRNAAKKRWSDASALQVDSKSNAKRREEKRIEEKKVLSTTVDRSFEILILEIIRRIKSEHLGRDVKEYKVTPKRINLISKRKKDFNKLWPGRNFEKACEFAFRYKAKEWFGKDTFIYFEPETLLSEKFASYLEKAEQDKGEPYKAEVKPKGNEVVYRIPEDRV